MPLDPTRRSDEQHADRKALEGLLMDLGMGSGLHPELRVQVVEEWAEKIFDSTWLSRHDAQIVTHARRQYEHVVTFPYTAIEGLRDWLSRPNGAFTVGDVAFEAAGGPILVRTRPWRFKAPEPPAQEESLDEILEEGEEAERQRVLREIITGMQQKHWQHAIVKRQDGTMEHIEIMTLKEPPP